MRAWSSARYVFPLPPGHRFPIHKYTRVRERVITDGLLTESEIGDPDAVAVADLALVHDAHYIRAIMDGSLAPSAERRLGLPWSPALVQRAFRAVQGTVEAATDAVTDGLGINLAGGTHHAFRDRGEGFCVFNDVAVAIRSLQQNGHVTRAAIIDLDVHQGNGNASIFRDDSDVFTFSMHGAKNYPFRKIRGTIDVDLADGTADVEYLSRLQPHLDIVFERARPDLVAYLAGADPYHRDRFGRLALTADGLRERDRMVFEACARRGVPVVVTLAGGYAPNLDEVAGIHADTVRLALSTVGGALC